MASLLALTICAIALLKRAGVSAGRTAAILALLPVVALMGLLVVAPGYLPPLLAESSGRAAIATAVAAALLPALFLARIIRTKV